MNPSLYEAQVSLALAYQSMERIEPWRIAAQKAIELNARLAEAHVLMSDSYRSSPAYGCSRQRDAVLAERFLKRALELDPRSAAAYTSLTNHLAWAGREAESLRAVDEALKVLPGNVDLMRDGVWP